MGEPCVPCGGSRSTMAGKTTAEVEQERVYFVIAADGTRKDFTGGASAYADARRWARQVGTVVQFE